MYRGFVGHRTGRDAMGMLYSDVGSPHILHKNSFLGANKGKRMLLFLIFFPTPGPEAHEPGSPPPPSWRDALTVVLTCVGHFVIIVIVSAVFQLFYPDALATWATALGICAAILACVQYIPQLYTTWRLQHVMSLSIPMMCIQTPGSFVFATSLAIRMGGAGWSAWGVYVVTGLLQGCLLVMAIRFELRDRRKRQQLAEGEAEPDDEGLGGDDGFGADERTPLLRTLSPNLSI